MSAPDGAAHAALLVAVSEPRPLAVIDLAGMAALLEALAAGGHELYGPTATEDAIVIDAIHGAADLPAGVGDEQAPGHYRLRRRSDGALFGHAAPAQGWKRVLFPPRVALVRIRRRGDTLAVEPPPSPARPRALVGVRPCDLAAISIHDRVLAAGPYRDADYEARRAGLFVLVVHCGAPGDTCFCASAGTGPRAAPGGWDLAATELCDDDGHRFVIEVGSDAGAEVLARVASRAATDDDRTAARAVTDRAAARMRTALPDGVRERVLADLEHPRWSEVAARCLGCASCTQVCPTCSCTTVVDDVDLSGEVADRTRRWDSCFAADFAYVHGGSVRPTLRARYRQWLTHKLATWHEQFGSSGCVGCGRCITWCPAGIDLTAEAAALATPASPARS